MKLNAPATYEDITVGQLIEHGDREIGDLELVRVYCELSKEQLNETPYQLVSEAARHIKKILAKPMTKHQRVFIHKGVKYGFIPDWSKFKTKEYVDLVTFAKNPTMNAHKIMAVLFRPVTDEHGSAYSIAEYKGTAEANLEAYRSMSAARFKGAMVFFSATRNNSLRILAQSLREQQNKKVTGVWSTFKNSFRNAGRGITRWLRLRTANFSKWMK